MDVLAFATSLRNGQARVLDVRSMAEWQAGHVPGSIHCSLPDLAASLPDALAGAEEVWLACEQPDHLLAYV